MSSTAVKFMALQTGFPALFSDQGGVSRCDGIRLVSPSFMTVQTEGHRVHHIDGGVVIMAATALMLSKNFSQFKVL